MLDKDQIHSIIEKVSAAEKRSGRGSGSTKIIAVSKTFSVEFIEAAYNLGLKNFGENYVQEFLPKYEKLNKLKINWHFVGHLQSNKVKQIANKCCLIHSVDTYKLITELAKRTEATSQKILLEINLSGEQSKSGAKVEDLPYLIETVQKHNNLQLTGLMFMPPVDLSLDQQHYYFAQARKLAEKYKGSVSLPHSLCELSMGTSADFEVAIEEGATMVRLGTIIFGERFYGRK